MKHIPRIFRTLMILWTVIPLLVSSQNIMQMGSATTGPNQDFSVGVSIANADPFVAFQFDLPVPAGFSYVTGSAALNPARSNGHVLIAQVITGNKLRIMAYSPMNLPFTGNSGQVVTFQLHSGTVPGDYPLIPEGAIIGGTNQQNILTGTVNGVATILAPDIHLPVSAFDFDRTPLGQSTTRNVTIQNTGNQPLNVTSVTFNSSYFEVIGNTVFSIGAGQSAEVTVKFNAVVKGVYDKVMTVASNDPDESSVTVNLHARAYAVNELHTGDMNAYSGHIDTLNFSINNMEPFTGFQFDLSLPSPMTYIMGSAALSDRKTNHVVSAGMISPYVLRVVAYSTDLQPFTGNSGLILSLGFMVSGTGGWYPLNLANTIIADSTGVNIISDYFNGSLYIAAPDISCATTLDFGEVSVLDTLYQDLMVYNYGNDTLKINQVTFSNPDFGLKTSLPLQILPYESKPIRVAFHCGNEGQASGILKIFSNDPDAYENPLSVALSAFSFIPNYMVVPLSQCKNGDTVSLSVNVSNMESFVGFQFDLGFPTCMSYIPNSAALTSRARDHIIISSLPDAAHVRVMAFSMQQLPFTGDTGAVATLKFVVNSGDPGYLSAPLELTNAILGDAQSQNILYSVVNGFLRIRYQRNLSGTFTYNNSADTPLSSVKVILNESGSDIDSTLTDSFGHYSFPSVWDGAYRINAQTGAPWEGVNGTDALKVMRKIVGLELFPTIVRDTAADVNLTHSITAMDVLMIKKRFVGLETGFERGDWVFEKQSGGDSIFIDGQNTTVDFYGLCTGDVNGSHIPGNSIKSSNVVMSTADVEMFAGPGQEIYLPVSLKNNCTMGALSLVLSYPEESFHIEEVTTVEGTPLFSVISGVLKIVWAEMKPIKVLTDEPIAFIRVRIDENQLPGAVLRLDNASDLTEISDGTGEPCSGIKISIPAVQITDETRERPMFIAPNPARHETKVFFWFDEEGTTTLKMYDLKGTLVKTVHSILTNGGLNQTILDVSSLSSGEYIIDLVSTGSTLKSQKSGKLIIR